MDDAQVGYEAPLMTVLGSIHDLTHAPFNKNGTTPDIFSETVPVVGDLTSAA